MGFNPFEGIEPFNNVADNKTIEMIDIGLLLENEKNKYRTKGEADIEAQNEELIASIEEYGILQPLLARKMEDGTYKIISGHRRKLMCQRLVEEGKTEFNKIPCIIYDQIIDEDDEQLKIIATNKNREKNTWEKMQEVNVMTEILARKKEKGEIKGGRLIEWVAKNLEMSKSTVDRLQKIDKGLEPELKKALKDGDLKQSPAETLARMSAVDQKAVYEKTGGKITQADIDEYEKEKDALKASETSFMDEMEQPQKKASIKRSDDFHSEQPQMEADTSLEIAAAKHTMNILMKNIERCSKIKEIEKNEGNEQAVQLECAKIEYLGKVLGRVQQDLFEMTRNDMFRESGVE